jgi:outer membrane lipoprotein-sorting protein
MRWALLFVIQSSLLVFSGFAGAEELDAKALIGAAMDHWRGKTSYIENSMTIHRPSWERSMSMVGWTSGDKISLMRVTAPAKDAGNGTLTKDHNMWSYTPKINRIIKVPSSMMGQSWMGSDFSNKDVSKSTDILNEYDHSLLQTYTQDQHTVYVIEAIPHEDAPVVWGKQVVHVRDDYIMLEEQYWDQDGILVKTMKARQVQEMSGRSVATVMRMGKTDTPDEWTELRISNIEFDVELPPNLFTLANLRNPRQ